MPDALWKSSDAGLIEQTRRELHKIGLAKLEDIVDRLHGENVFNLWEVNQDAEYHEAGKAGEQSSGATGQRLVPTDLKEAAAAVL